MTDVESPSYVPGHGLLRGRTAVLTAAAGAGIGGATARRFLEEGARVLISDAHTRRLKEHEGALAAEFGTAAVAAMPCDVTDEDQVQPAVRHGRGGPRPTRRRRQQRGSRWDFGTGRHERRTVVPGAGRDPDGDVPVRAGRPAALPRPGRRRRDRQQRLRPRLARPGRAGALRRRQGGRHGADPVRGGRGGGVRGTGQRRRTEPRHAPSPREGDLPGLLEELTAREAFGRHAEPWEVANVIVFLASGYSSYLTGEVVSVSGQRA